MREKQGFYYVSPEITLSKVTRFCEAGSYFEADDGAKMFYKIWKPAQIKAVLILVHGFAEHVGRYEHVAKYFADRGLVVGALDQRGHGRSEGKRGHIDKFQQYLDDLKKFVGTMKKEYSGKRCFIFGHSMGGTVSLSYCLKYPEGIDGVIISSAGLKITAQMARLKPLAKVLSIFLPKVSLSAKIDPDWLSHDKAVGKKYSQDPLIFNCATAKFGAEFIKAIDELQGNAGQLKVPCLIMYAGDDKLVDPHGSEEFFSQLTLKDKKLIKYAGFYHELLNEIDKGRVFKDIENWLLPRVHPEGSH